MKQKIKDFFCWLIGHNWKYAENIFTDGRKCKMCHKKQKMVAKDTSNGIKFGYLDEGIEWNRQNMHLGDFSNKR